MKLAPSGHATGRGPPAQAHGPHGLRRMAARAARATNPISYPKTGLKPAHQRVLDLQELLDAVV
jgi:hypothetical protein